MHDFVARIGVNIVQSRVTHYNPPHIIIKAKVNQV